MKLSNLVISSFKIVKWIWIYLCVWFDYTYILMKVIKCSSKKYVWRKIMKDLGKILARILDNLSKILASTAIRLNNLGKILVISWQDLAKIGVLPRPCHDLQDHARSYKILPRSSIGFFLCNWQFYTFQWQWHGVGNLPSTFFAIVGLLNLWGFWT
jgi:hypothetical protein